MRNQVSCIVPGRVRVPLPAALCRWPHIELPQEAQRVAGKDCHCAAGQGARPHVGAGGGGQGRRRQAQAAGAIHQLHAAAAAAAAGALVTPGATSKRHKPGVEGARVKPEPGLGAPVDAAGAAGAATPRPQSADATDVAAREPRTPDEAAAMLV
jgi:hypothetical protein